MIAPDVMKLTLTVSRSPVAADKLVPVTKPLKLTFSGIVTGTSFSSTVGDISTVSVSFQTTGDITSAI